MTTQPVPLTVPGELASLSPDGKYLVDESTSGNIVPNDTNGVSDVFVYNTVANAFQRISVADDGTQGDNASFTHSDTTNPASLISADDRYVVFNSEATNLVSDDPNGSHNSIFVYDRTLNTISIVPGEVSNQDYGWPSISANGQYIAYESSGVGRRQILAGSGGCAGSTQASGLARGGERPERMAVGFSGQPPMVLPVA